MSALDDLLHAQQQLRQRPNLIGNATVNIVVSNQLPMPPSDGGNARRIVRHGLSDVLEWLGQSVGPKPGELIHMFAYSDPATGAQTAFVSLHGLSQIKLAGAVDHG